MTPFDVTAELARLLAELRAAAPVPAVPPVATLPAAALPAAGLPAAGLPATGTRAHGAAMLGVRRPALLALARAWLAAHAELEAAAQVAFAWRLWTGASLEEQLLASRLLPADRAVLLDLPWPETHRWLQASGTAAALDAIVVHLLGPWVQHDLAARLPQAGALLAAGDPLLRRAPLVLTAWLNRRASGPGYPAETLELAAFLLGAPSHSGPLCYAML